MEKSESTAEDGMPPVDLKDYIQQVKIKQMRCRRHTYEQLVPEQKFCLCGRPKGWAEHIEGKDIFDKKIHCEPEECSCYGDINFTSFGAQISTPAKYIRVETGTEPGVLWEVMRDYWQVAKPKLIISVTGGADCVMNRRLVESFKRGVINAATTTDAWIITGGTNTGVMAFVGDAVREYTLRTGKRVTALGIATWGIVDNKACLVGPKNKTSADYSSKELEKKPFRVSPLDPHHTHFILVDDGTERSFGKEIEIRAELENYISNSATIDTKVHVPVVSLVLGGGENTILTAFKACTKGTPIVVVKGSGRAADLIASAYLLTKTSSDSDVTEFPEDFDKIVSEEARHIMRIDNDTTLQNVVTFTRGLLQKSCMVTVFSLSDDDSGSTKEMDQAILYALLKAKRAEPVSQLSLALAWDCADIAKKEIFTSDNRSIWKNNDQLNEAMQKALVQDKPAFVKLFLDNGIVLSDFLTTQRLEALYRNVILEEQYPGPGPLLLKEIFSEKSGENRSILSDVGEIIDHLVEECTETFYRDFVNSGDGQNKRKGSIFKEKVPLENIESTKENGPCLSKIDHERELFLWAVLMNRQTLALHFWRIGKDHLGGALFGSTILGALAEEANSREEMDLSQDMQAHAGEFESLAVGVLNECYKLDKAKSHRLLTRKLDSWGKTTLFSLAEGAELMDFMEQSSCQSKLNRIWMGKMALYTATWKIIVGLLIPLMVLVIKFTRNTARPSTVSAKTKYKEEQENVNKPSKMYSATLCGCKDKQSDTVPFWTAVYFFHTTPFVKFCYHSLSYLVYLSLFSFFLLTDLNPGSISVYEYIVWGWSITLILDEFRQLFVTGDTLSEDLSGYFSSLWNRFDSIIFLLLLVSVILRCTLAESVFVWARMFYVLTLTLLFLRSMQFFFVEKNIGPKVVMIKRMLTDLAFFLLLLSTFLFAFGVAQQVLVYPNTPPSWSILRQVVAEPYWNIYGNLYLDQLNGDVPGCSDNATLYDNDPNIPRCPTVSWLAIILNAIYMLLTNVLLLNLLIAMFSYTFERVQENSEKVWRFHRYALVYEYFDKPTLAPPLIIFSQIWRLCKYLYRQCSGTPIPDNDFNLSLSEEENQTLTAFERAGMDSYLIQQHLNSMVDIGSKVSTTQEKIEKVMDDLEQLREHILTQQPQSSSSAMPKQNEVKQSPKDSGSARSEIDSLKRKISSMEGKMDDFLNMLERRLPRPPPPPLVEISNLK